MQLLIQVELDGCQHRIALENTETACLSQPRQKLAPTHSYVKPCGVTSVNGFHVTFNLLHSFALNKSYMV